MAFFGVVSSWKDPAVVSLNSLKSAYQIGIGTGDIEHAAVSSDLCENVFFSHK